MPLVEGLAAANRPLASVVAAAHMGARAALPKLRAEPSALSGSVTSSTDTPVAGGREGPAAAEDRSWRPRVWRSLPGK
jgi:hypothetical protein